MTSMTLTYFNDLPQWLSYDLLPYHMIAIYPIVYIQLWLSRSSHRKCSIKNVFLEISQNSQENTCARISFLIKFQASGRNFQEHLLYRTLLVTASGQTKNF